MKAAKFSRDRVASTTMSSTIMGPKPSSVSATKPLGPCQVGDSVIFVASYPKANVIQSAGDFNDWQPGKTPMTKTGDGTWQARVPLAKGIHRYRLVVDGKWQHDPHNDSTEVNPYGELNSVIRVI
jgi:1,4-alpha-glucan branching enzyme